jgi:hypothetical protein
MHYLTHEGTPYIVVLRENSLIEIVRNFTDTVLAESRVTVEKILPTFGISIQFLKQDGNIEFSQTFDKFNTNRETLTSRDYYRLQAMPPQSSSQYQIHRKIQFY